VLDNIERVSSADPGHFARDRVAPGRPLIITDSYVDTPAAQLADESSLRELVGDVVIETRPAGVEPLLLGDDGGQRRTTLSSFLDELHSHGAHEECCAELDCPDELGELVPRPPISAAFDDEQPISQLFLAGAGCTAHLHYDADLREVLMVQVLGHKRYVVIDPTQSRKLRPEHRPGLSRTSGLFLQHFEEPDLDALLRSVGAWDCVLAPGEVLYIPAAAWHWVRYLEPAMSINFRFAPNPRLRFFAEQVSDRSVEWLCVASHFRDDRNLTAADRDAFDALTDGVQSTGGERGHRSASLLADICAQLHLDIAKPPLDMGDWDRRRRRDQVEAGPAPAAAATVWSPDTRVAMPDGCLLVVPVRGGPLVLANRGRLAAELPPDPTHTWTWPVLAQVDRVPGVSVAELGAAFMVEPDLVAEFLAGMERAGWVRVVGEQPRARERGPQGSRAAP
jgi:hypothetical protein